MTRKNRRKFSGPLFRKEALKQVFLIITGSFKNFHPTGVNSLFMPVSTAYSGGSAAGPAYRSRGIWFSAGR